MTTPRLARGILALGAIAFVAAVVVASQSPGPRAWALHVPGFLPDSSRALVLGVLVLGAALLTIDFFRPAPAPGPAQTGKRPKVAKQSRTFLGMPAWTGWLLLIPWAWLLTQLQTRTLFLGDGQIWLDNVRSGHPHPYSEPLATATWWLYWTVLRSLGIPFEAGTARGLPMLCGMIAVPLLVAIAREIAPKGASRAAGIALLVTLGLSQLYFGYIESYPMVSVAVLAYLWLGLRLARGADSPYPAAAALAVAIAFHLSCVYLIPSFFLLAWRVERPVAWRAGLAVAPIAAATLLLLLLGYGPSHWADAFAIASTGAAPGQNPAAVAPPYGMVSAAHLSDILNAILLALPAPLLLLLAGTAARAEGAWSEPRTLFLAAAALPGLLLAALRVLPVAPAQDWDLSAILLVPLAVLGVGVGLRSLALRGRAAAGAALVGLGSLLAFVLVNANEESSLRRYETLVGPGALITPYARGYGNDLLATYDISRRDFPRALEHAQRALEAEPTEARYWVKKGAALFQMQRFEEAIPILQEGLRRGPERGDGWYDLGNALAKTRRFPEAVASYREAIRRSEPRPEYFNNLGVALYNSGQRDSARVVWTDVARRWPWYTLARKSLIEYFGTDG